MEQVFERRPWLLPVCLALLTLLFLRPLIIPPGPNEALNGGDFVSFFYPMQTFIRQSVLSGVLPLWNPHQFIGYPIAGDPQAGLFYPATWLMWLVGVVRGMNLALALHVWLGAWGMAALARRFRATYMASLLAGVIYGMSEWMAARLYAGHYTIVLAAAWIPWLMAAYDDALAQRTWRSVLPAVAFMGLLLLAGSPPMDVYGVIALLTLWLYYAARAEAPLQAAWYAAKHLILIAFGGAVLGAAILIPAGQFTALAVRGSSDLAFANSFALPPAQYIGLALPGFFGDPKATDYTHYWGADFFQEFVAYAGLLPILAIPLAFRWRRRENWYFLALIAFGLIASIGLTGGLMPLLWEWIPGFASFRTPGRALYFVMLGLAGLTAMLITALQNSTAEERREALRSVLGRWIPLAAVVAFIGAIYFAGWYASANHTEPMPVRAIVISGSLASAGVILLGIWFVLWLWTNDQPRVAHWALLLTGALIVLDAWHVGYPIIGIGPISEDALWAGARINVPIGPDARVVAPGGMETLASASGHLNVAGYNPLVLDTYAKLTAL
ncbi:MAG TPA: hypothetical protein VKQ72_18405, partial [Aggregatilineales bacterium]|nr:hypothetical protein [Aggregatilineales bacterium]